MTKLKNKKLLKNIANTRTSIDLAQISSFINIAKTNK